ncbi:unnamed protein product [Parajaminaea phylloscopi]
MGWGSEDRNGYVDWAPRTASSGVAVGPPVQTTASANPSPRHPDAPRRPSAALGRCLEARQPSDRPTSPDRIPPPGPIVGSHHPA